MPNKSYLIGYRFENRVKKHLEKEGFVVFRQGKSAFPDLICLSEDGTMLVECKVGKYLSKKEKERAKELAVLCPFIVAHRVKGRIETYRIVA